MLLWVIGGGGLLGSHLHLALRQRFPQAQLWQPTPPHFSWHDTARLAAELEDAVAAFAATVLMPIALRPDTSCRRDSP